jgi:hypothetical protein
VVRANQFDLFNWSSFVPRQLVHGVHTVSHSSCADEGAFAFLFLLFVSGTCRLRTRVCGSNFRTHACAVPASSSSDAKYKHTSFELNTTCIPIIRYRS